MRILLIDHDAVALAFALRCARAGHAVRWYIHPKDSNNQHTGDGFKGIEKVDNWITSVKWADLIWCSGNDHYLPKLDALRKTGVKFFGPSAASADLEIKRSRGMKMFEDAGIPVPKYQEFKSLKDAEAYVRKTEQRYVFKTLGDNEDKSLSYCSKTPADMVARLQRWQKLGMNPKGPVILQEFIDGVEFAVSCWVGSQGFIAKPNENFEFKKLLSGNCGPNSGESGTIMKYVERSSLADDVLRPLEKSIVAMGHIGDIDVNCIVDVKGAAWPLEWTCFSEDTDILTGEGWIPISTVRHAMSIATMNPASGELEYRPCEKVIVKDYVGEMIHFGGTHSAPDFMVTPDHQMWVRKHRKADYQFIRASECFGLSEVQRGIGSWRGDDRDTFVLPSYIETHCLGRYDKTIDIHHAPIKMSMTSWMGLLGLIISEGSVGEYIVSIAQAPHRHHKIAKFLESLPFAIRWQRNLRSLQIHSRQLCKFLLELGFSKQPTRRIPREFMDLSSRHLSVLLDALIAGDGSIHKINGQRTYYTTSPGLADDVQELMLKCGYPARIARRQTAGTIMSVRNGPAYIRNHDTYVVQERRQRTTGWLDPRMTKRVRYAGKVYCCNVPPHHLIYVRRNGNAAWCGNCRPGWPAFNIMLACHKGDPAQWMLDACNGKDTLQVSPQVACGIVLAQPDYPYSLKTKAETEGVPIYGVTAKNQQHIFPQCIKLEKQPDMQDGKIIDRTLWTTAGDYLAIVTGLGKTIVKAKERAYDTVKEIHVPDLIYRDDVGEKLEKELPKLQAFGYAAEFQYS